jgi:hypothetical protein
MSRWIFAGKREKFAEIFVARDAILEKKRKMKDSDVLRLTFELARWEMTELGALI